MNRRRFIGTALAAGAQGVLAQSGRPDLLILNAHITTMDVRRPFVEALAISGGKIAATGTTAGIRALGKDGTAVIDAEGRAIIPGLTDCHIHFPRRRADHVTRPSGRRGEPPGAAGPDCQVRRRPSALPGKRQLDAVLPDRPAYLRAFDGHSAWVNSKALQVAGIGKETPDPPGGVIVRDPATGEHTGELVFSDGTPIRGG